MLGQETEVRPQLLPVHAWPIGAGVGTADMHELGLGKEDHLLPLLADAIAQVDLFVEHEEAGVEPT